MTDEQGGVDAPNGLVAGRYRLLRLVRTSATHTVWEATDERLHRPVALTMLDPPSGSTEDHGVVVGHDQPSLADELTEHLVEQPHALKLSRQRRLANELWVRSAYSAAARASGARLHSGATSLARRRAPSSCM